MTEKESLVVSDGGRGVLLGIDGSGSTMWSNRLGAP